MPDVLSEAMIAIQADLGLLKESLDQAKQLFQSEVNGLVQIANGFATSLASAFNVGLESFSLGALAKDAADFESAWRQIDVTMQEAGHAGGAAIDGMRERVIALSKETQFAATEIARAATVLTKTGQTPEQAAGNLKSVTNFATASNQSPEQAAQSLTGIAQRTGTGDLDKISDVIVAGAARSRASIADLSQAVQAAGPVASQAKIPLEDLVATIAKMGGGEQAGMALRQALMHMLQDGSQAQKVFQSIGVSMNDLAAGKQGAFLDMLNKLGKANLTAGEAAQLFGTRAAPLMLAALRNIDSDGRRGADSIKALSDALKDAGTAGTTDRAAASLNDTFSAKVNILKSSIQSLGIALGGPLLESLRPTLDSLTEFVNKLSTLNPEIVQSVAQFGVWAGGITMAGGALAALATSIGGTITAAATGAAGIGLVAGVIGAAAGGIAALGLPLGILIAPIAEITGGMIAATAAVSGFGAVIVGLPVAIAALAGAAQKLAGENDIGKKFRDAASEIGESLGKIGSVFGNGFAQMSAIWDSLTSEVAESIAQAAQAIDQFLKENEGTFNEWATLVKETTVNAFKAMKDVASNTLGAIKSLLNQLGDSIDWSGVKDSITQILDYASLLTTDFSATWEIIKTAGLLAWSELKDFISIRVPGEAEAAMVGLGAAIVASFRATVDTVAQMFGTSFDEIAQFATAAFDECAQVAKAFGDAAIKVAGVAAAAVAASMGPAGLAFAAAQEALANLGPVSDAIVGGFKDNVAAIAKAHNDTNAQVAAAGQTALQAVADKHVGIAQAALDAFKAAQDEALKGLDTESAETKELQKQLDLQLQLLQAERDRQRAKAAAAGNGPPLFAPGGKGFAYGSTLPYTEDKGNDQGPRVRYSEDQFKMQFIRPEDLYKEMAQWANNIDPVMIQRQIADNTDQTNTNIGQLGVMLGQKLDKVIDNTGKEKPAKFAGGK